MKKENTVLSHQESEQIKEAIWSVLETYSPTSKCQYKSVFQLANFAGITMDRLDLYALPDTDLRDLLHDELAAAGGGGVVPISVGVSCRS